MSRLPEPGGDANSWGQVLNDYLSVEHNADGTLKKAADITQAASTASTALQTAQAKYTLPVDGIPELSLHADVRTKLNTVSSGGVANGSITSTQIATDTIVDANIKSDAAIAQAKIAGLTNDLAGKAATSHAHAAGDITSGTLGVTRGGTGAATLSGVLKGNGTAAITGSATIADLAAPTAPVGFGSQRITTVADPSSAQDAATKNYVDTRTKIASVPFSQPGAAVTGNSGKWRAPVAGTVTRISLMSDSGPVGSNLSVRFYKNTTEIATLNVADGANTAEVTTTTATTFVAGDKLSVTALSVGSTTAATNIVAQFDYTYTA